MMSHFKVRTLNFNYTGELAMLFCSKSKLGIRDRWIWLTALLNVSITQYMLGMYAATPHDLTPSAKLAVEPGGMLFNSLLFFPITYYFSYHKQGYRWLTFCLIAGPLFMLSFALNQGSKEIDAMGYSHFSLGMLLNAVLYIPWYYLSFKIVQLHRQKG